MKIVIQCHSYFAVMSDIPLMIRFGKFWDIFLRFFGVYADIPKNKRTKVHELLFQGSTHFVKDSSELRGVV